MLCGIFGKPKDDNSLHCTHCSFKHEPQAASGIYSCRQRYRGRDGHARHCGGTYQVLRGQAEKVMQEFRRRQLEEYNAALKVTEKARKAARKFRKQDPANPHSRYSKPLPAVPLQVSPSSSRPNTRPKAATKPHPRTFVVAIEPTAVRRRDATNRGRTPIQALGKEWNHSRVGHGDEIVRPRQVKGTASGSWYQPAPPKRALAPNVKEPWYHPL